MAKLLHCRKITAILLVIQISVLVLGIAFGAIGRSIHNDLMTESTKIMPFITSALAAEVVFLERKSIKPRNNTILTNKKMFILCIVLSIILSIILALLVLALLGFIIWPVL